MTWVPIIPRFKISIGFGNSTLVVPQDSIKHNIVLLYFITVWNFLLETKITNY